MELQIQVRLSGGLTITSGKISVMPIDNEAPKNS